MPRAPARPPSGPHQLGFHRPTQLPTRPAGQAPAWQPTDLCGDPPLRHLSCLSAYMAPQTPLARARVNTRRGGDGQDGRLPPVPDKARTPKLGALNAPCPIMRGITSHHCTLSISCVRLWRPLFPIKGGPRRSGGGFGFLELLTIWLFRTPHDSALWSPSRPIAS